MLSNGQASGTMAKSRINMEPLQPALGNINQGMSMGQSASVHGTTKTSLLYTRIKRYLLESRTVLLLYYLYVIDYFRPAIFFF